MDVLEFFEVDEPLTSSDLTFLTALRAQLADGVRPYFVGHDDNGMNLALDVDAPDHALVSVGLALKGAELLGDRISVHDRSFPPAPTTHGFRITGTAEELAA